MDGKTAPLDEKRLAEQHKIDIANLRFYAQIAYENDWDTVEIANSVIIQTLKEIADRFEQIDSLRRGERKPGKMEI